MKIKFHLKMVSKGPVSLKSYLAFENEFHKILAQARFMEKFIISWGKSSIHFV